MYVMRQGNFFQKQTFNYTNIYIFKVKNVLQKVQRYLETAIRPLNRVPKICKKFLSHRIEKAKKILKICPKTLFDFRNP